MFLRAIRLAGVTFVLASFAAAQNAQTVARPGNPNPYLDWLLHKPVVPPVPEIKDAGWIKNPIDSFILAKLEAKGMRPAPPASKRALLRRVYFDLIGVPPSPAEMDAFESDREPDAYEKV